MSSKKATKNKDEIIVEEPIDTEPKLAEEVPKKVKKHIEFSKLIVIIAIIIFAVIAIWSMFAYYFLVNKAIEAGTSTLPDSALPVACVGTILGAILSYCLYQGALKSSLNKNNLKVDQLTGEVKAIMDNDFLEAVEQNNNSNDT